MKKISVLFFTLVTAVIVCSCSESIKIPNIVTNINNNALVEYGNIKYECHITRPTSEVISISINSPDNLSGLTFRRSEGKYSVSYGELLCRTDGIVLPETSFPIILTDILSVIGKQENLIYQSSESGLFVFSGNSKLGGFSLTADSSGNISEITQESTGLKVIFENSL